MKYRLLGTSGLRVSEAALGTMTFGEDWGWGAAKDEARKVYGAFREAGGNFIDTANIYTNGTSELFQHGRQVSCISTHSNGRFGFGKYLAAFSHSSVSSTTFSMKRCSPSSLTFCSR